MVHEIQGDGRLVSGSGARAVSAVGADELGAMEPASNVRMLRNRELGRSILARELRRTSTPSPESGMILRPRLSIAARPGGLGVEVAGTPAHAKPRA